jgi:glycosyltransferase involved in cell wall biosynthesis
LEFVGDPSAPEIESWQGVTLRRLLQPISARHPRHAYDGEDEKIRALEVTWPKHLLEDVLIPAVAENRHVVVLAEDWQTVPACIALSDLAWTHGLRDALTLVWNANNPFGFHRIDWPRLGFVANLTTVSRWMKHEMWDLSINPVVLPNGLAGEAFRAVSARHSVALKQAVPADLLLVKIGRYDADKRWEMAIRTVAAARNQGINARLIARGGHEPYREVLRALADDLDLAWSAVRYDAGWPDHLRAITAPIVEVENFLPVEEVQLLYQTADAVLANSGREPFGLVGLEVMAAGGLAVIGTTGEDYGRAYGNAVMVETDDPNEIVHHLRTIAGSGLQERIRREGQRTAEHYRWSTLLPLVESYMDYFIQGPR